MTQDRLGDGAARLLRANGKVGNPFVLRSPEGASRSTPLVLAVLSALFWGGYMLVHGIMGGTDDRARA
jgi:hypothetical protein